MHKQGRYRGLRPHPEKLGVVPLEPGEVSRPVRVRASAQVHDWLRGFTAAELGQLLTQVWQQEAGQGLQGHRKPRKARARAAEGSSRGAEIAINSPLTLGTVPDDLQAHHMVIVEAMRQGAVIQQDHQGRWKLTGQGISRTLKPATVKFLQAIGVVRNR